jgi:hypothetical protein
MFQESDSNNFRFISLNKDGSAGHQGIIVSSRFTCVRGELKTQIKYQSLFILIVFREYEKSLFQVDLPVLEESLKPNQIPIVVYSNSCSTSVRDH